MTLQPSGRKPRVLIAHEHKVIADTLATILNSSGFEAKAVYSGEAVVESAPALKPDVLICDFIMPGINGIEASIIIRGLLPSCRILLTSGWYTSARQQLLEWGCELAVVETPIDPKTLLSMLEDIRLSCESGVV